MTSIIGDLKSADGLEQAVRQTLYTWFPTYLQELALQNDMPERLPSPRSYVSSPDVDHFLEEQLPTVIIVSPGLAGEPFHDGDGLYHVTWRIGVAIVAYAMDKESVNRNIKMYAAAARAILLQHASLGGYANALDWISEDFDQGPSDAQRTLALAAQTFNIQVADVVNRYAGPGPLVPIPPDPDTIPGGVWPVVESTDLDVEKKGVSS